MKRFRGFFVTGTLLALSFLAEARSADSGAALHTVYLVRHGVYFDGGKPAEPNADKSLTALGREQAQLARINHTRM